MSPLYIPLQLLYALAMLLCHGPVRVTCVIDGDTVWIEGEKIRLADIDAP